MPTRSPPPIVLLGAGGHGKAVLDLLHASGPARYRVVGLVDAAPRVARVLGAPVLGTEAALERLRAEGVTHAHPAIGDNAARGAAAERLRALGFALPALVHPGAILGSGVWLGEAAVVMARAVLGAEARIGRLALINTGAIVEHDGVVEEAAHIAPGAVLAGGVRIGAGSLVGAGACILPGLSVGPGATIGAGAVLTADAPAGARLAGVPARPIGQG